jgi:hypothetical protein
MTTKRVRAVIALLVAAVSMVTLAAAIAPGPASASDPIPYLKSSAQLWPCAYSTKSYCQTKWFPALASGTKLEMVCWIDTTGSDGKSHRWFYVHTRETSLGSQRSGYVGAGYVTNQQSRPHCHTTQSDRTYYTRRVWAADWAMLHYGKTGSGTGTSGGYAGLCLPFVQDSYRYTSGFAVDGGYGNPQNYWNKHPGHHTDRYPPVGALVFWTAPPGKTADHSHVALSIGNHHVVSTSFRSSTAVHVEDTLVNGTATYLGWLWPVGDTKWNTWH